MALPAAMALATGDAGAEASAGASAKLAGERLESLRGLITREPVETIVKMRRICASGQSPAVTARSRSLGAESQPDSSDRCPTVLARIARDGELLSFYRDLSVELTGSSSGHEQVPASIALAVMKTGSNQFAVGGDRAAVITAALALDAGFTVAYGKGARLTAEMPDLPALKPIAERCLGQNEANLALCYSTGYVYGARAVSGQPMAGL